MEMYNFASFKAYVGWNRDFFEPPPLTAVRHSSPWVQYSHVRRSQYEVFPDSTFANFNTLDPIYTEYSFQFWTTLFYLENFIMNMDVFLLKSVEKSH